MNKQKTLNVRFQELDFNYLKNAAKKLGLTTSDFVRTIVNQEIGRYFKKLTKEQERKIATRNEIDDAIDNIKKLGGK